MKKSIDCIFLILMFLSNKTQAQNLKDVTLGFAAGVSNRFTDTYDYSLSTGAMPALKVQKLSKGAFVVSSVLTVKFKKLKVDIDSEGNKSNQLLAADDKPAKPKDRWALNVGLNLLEIKNDVKFNTSIDGGLGIGYFIHANTQIAFMFDVATLRQMRPYIVEMYEDKQIPKGNDFYNALDVADNDLFYNKTTCGISLKVIFSF